VEAVVYSMQFRGDATTVAPGVMKVALTAPSGALLTTIDAQGVHGCFEPAPGEEATFRSRLCFADDAATFEECGTIVFGAGHALHLSSVGAGLLGPSPDPHLRHGTVMWQVEKGEGQFEAAEGRITSNFFLSDTGELSDNQVGLIFVKGLQGSPGR
jgi:hypothetical protein